MTIRYKRPEHLVQRGYLSYLPTQEIIPCCIIQIRLRKKTNILLSRILLDFYDTHRVMFWMDVMTYLDMESLAELTTVQHELDWELTITTWIQ